MTDAKPIESTASRSPRGRTLGAGLGLLVIFGVASLYGLRLFAPCDDAYIYYIYVKNFFEGHGLTYNGMRVQGYTSPLWMALLMAGWHLPGELPRAGSLVTVLSGLFALWAVYRLGRCAGLSPWWALVAPALLAVTGDFAFYMTSGMETVLFTAMVSLSLCYAVADDGGRSLRSPLFPIVLGGMVLARPEGCLVVVVIVAYLAWSSRRWLWSLVPLGGAAVVVFPVVAATHAYYGDWLPNTYYAKATAGFANVTQGAVYFFNFVEASALTVAIAIFFVVFRWRSIGRAAVPLAILLVVWAGNVVIQGGDNLVGGRAMLPLVPALYLLVVLAARALPPRMAVATLVAAGIFQFAKYNLGHPYGSSWNHEVAIQASAWDDVFAIRRDMGLRLDRELDPDATIAVCAAGIMPYYAERTTIDMLGLNNRHIARHGHRDRSLPFGHQVGDGRYVLDQEPDVILLRGLGTIDNAFFVSEREMKDDPDFQRTYNPRKMPEGYAYFRWKRPGRRAPGRR